MREIFFGLGILSALWGVASSLVIASYLSQRGIKINWLLFRIFMLKYIHQYHKITKQESGKPGPWYYSFIASMNLALIFVILGVVFKGI